jgi:hypothetical protein
VLESPGSPFYPACFWRGILNLIEGFETTIRIGRGKRSEQKDLKNAGSGTKPSEKFFANQPKIRRRYNLLS